MSVNFLREALTAIKEAHGLERNGTPCKIVNDILWEYPDALQGAIAEILDEHERGEHTECA